MAAVACHFFLRFGWYCTGIVVGCYDFNLGRGEGQAKKKEKNGKTSSNREWHIGIRRGVARSFFEGQREKQRQSSITYILYSLADSNKPR